MDEKFILIHLEAINGAEIHSSQYRGENMTSMEHIGDIESDYSNLTQKVGSVFWPNNSKINDYINEGKEGLVDRYLKYSFNWTFPISYITSPA